MKEQVRRTIHYTELQPLPESDPLAADFNAYVREIPRWLAEGQEGRFVLIHDGQVIGLYDSWDAASRVGSEKFLLQPMLVQQILTEEPIRRVRGYS